MNEFFRVFRAFSDMNRIRVLEMLQDGEQCACVLLDDLNISQPTLSHHMKLLCESGIVTKRKVGKWQYYSINEDGLRHASELLEVIKSHRMYTVIRIMARLRSAGSAWWAKRTA